MQAEDLAYTGLVGQRELLANRSLEARELMSLYLDRIERLNPRLNAFVSVHADAALREADEAQQSLDRGDPRPLLGIPFAVKDEHDLAGEVTSLGTGATAAVAQRDSEIVAILREAGAIAVGKTALPELGMHPFTESVTWGVTRNPWDVSRTRADRAEAVRRRWPRARSVRDRGRRRRFHPHSGVVLQPLRPEGATGASEHAGATRNRSEGCRCSAC